MNRECSPSWWRIRTRFGAKVESFDAAEALAVPGVVDVKQIPSGVAVYAQGTWPAIKGREKLRVTWDDTSAEKRGTAQLVEEYRALAAKPGTVAGSHGDAEAALTRADKVIEAEYLFPYLAHAPMEPLDGYLRWDGQRAVARFGSQFQTFEHKTIADVLGLPIERVELETMLAGGSFGRRAQSTMHLVGGAGGGRQGDRSGTSGQAALDARGRHPRRLLSAAVPAPAARRGAGRQDRRLEQHRRRPVDHERHHAGRHDGEGRRRRDLGRGFEGDSLRHRGLPLRSAHHRRRPCRCCGGARSATPTPATPSSASSTNCCEAAGQDPVAGRLALMGKQPRAAGVLRAVAELAKWSGPGVVNGRARGVAVVESFNTFVAQIAEVSAGDGDGPRVHKVWCAVDCGVAVNPDVIRAQIEGGIGYGLGHMLYAEIGLDGGRAGADPTSTPIVRCASTRCRRSRSSSFRRRRSRPASASPACRRSDRRWRMPWRGSGSAGRGNFRSCGGWSDALPALCCTGRRCMRVS